MLRPGDEPIPGYRLERFLGKGQYGQVWQSSSPGQTSVALKFLNLDGKEGWREFRSIQQVKGIRHAHLMPITALWLLDEHGKVLNDDVLSSIAPTSQPAATETLTAAPAATNAKPSWLIVAQLLGEETLADRLKEHQSAGSEGIPPAELLQYMEEAAKGIDFLNSSKHDLGDGKVSLQHCDIKPANILLIGGSVLICDFGVVRTLGDKGISTTATSMVGSPAYMAPESIERRPSRWSDQYSLAITYYELRTGQLPFRQLEYMEVMDAHRKGTLDFSRVPEAEQKILARATSVSPQDRYPTSAEMVAELRRVVQGGPAPTKPRSFTRLSLAALVAAVALVLWVVFRPPPRLAPSMAQIQVIPRDAEVVVNGVPQPVSDDGMVRLEAADGDIQIAVRKPPEFEDAVRTLTSRELASQSRLTIQLRGNAVHFERQAEQQLRKGHFDQAVASYSRAIAIDATRTNFPPAVMLQRPETTVGKIRCLTVSQDGKWLVAGTEGRFVRVWNLASPDRSVVQDLQSHQQQVTSVAVSPSVIISADYLGVVEIHPLDKAASGPRATLRLNPGILVLKISPDGRWLFTASPRPDDSGSVVQLWDLMAADIAASGRRLLEHELATPALAVSRDGHWLFSGSWDGTARCQSLLDVSAPSTEVARFTDEEAEIYCLETVGDRAILGGRLSTAESPAQYCLFSVGTRPDDLQAFLGGHDATIEALTVGPSGRTIASGGEDGSVQVWRLDERGLPAKAIPLPIGHRNRVGGLAFDGTERWLLSVGDDGQVLMWDLEGAGNRTPVVVGLHEGTIAGIVMLANGGAVTAGEDGTVRLWDLPFCQMVKHACDKLQTRPSPAGSGPRGTEI